MRATQQFIVILISFHCHNLKKEGSVYPANSIVYYMTHFKFHTSHFIPNWLLTVAMFT